ncbi:MAG: TetR family transcriptional regulator [Propionibacteriaceae bacterium]|jgi:AcrR family transcriptional regulator|nr:TetR family transcriptional regulator [Propionibacteriaceae bacterium]
MVKPEIERKTRVRHVVLAQDRVIRRRDLTRPQILKTALEIIDELGLDQCTMQTLATRLNVTSRALYRHFADKEELLRGVADLVLADIVLPNENQPWQDQLRQIGLELKRVLDNHPQVTPLCARRASVFPGVIPIADSAVRAAEQAGISPQTAIRFAHAVTNYTIGFSLVVTNYLLQDPSSQTADPFDNIDLPRVPYAASQADFLRDFANSGDFASLNQYLFGLSLMVDGLQAAVLTDPS